MGIDKPGHEEPPARIDNLSILIRHQMVAFPHKGYDSMPDGDINPVLDPANVDVYQTPVTDDQISGFTSHGGRNDIQGDFVQPGTLMFVVFYSVFIHFYLGLL
jgi:hypothetical protein